MFGGGISRNRSLGRSPGQNGAGVLNKVVRSKDAWMARCFAGSLSRRMEPRVRLTDAPLAFVSPSQGQALAPRLFAVAASWSSARPSGAAPSASQRLAAAARPLLG